MKHYHYLSCIQFKKGIDQEFYTISEINCIICLSKFINWCYKNDFSPKEGEERLKQIKYNEEFENLLK